MSTTPMLQFALDFVTLPPAIAVASKTAPHVDIFEIGTPLCKAAGLDAIRAVREVGAVQASVDAGVAAAKKGGQLITGHVIARPHRFTEAIIANGDGKVVPTVTD